MSCDYVGCKNALIRCNVGKIQGVGTQRVWNEVIGRARGGCCPLNGVGIFGLMDICVGQNLYNPYGYWLFKNERF
jgi:hypothetical protein